MINKSSGVYNLIDKDGINKSINNVLSSGVDFNTYSSPKGLKDLRIEISKFLSCIWNCETNFNDMLITSGAQQSINLIVYSLLKEGDVVFIEEPTYFGAIDVFKERNVNLVGFNLENNDYDFNDLESKIIKYKPKFIYVTPTFNNPTGNAWNNDIRKKFLDIVNRYNVLVIEDDPYSLINYSDYNYKSLYQLNNGKNIFYIGTFSKYISPSINVGYILCDKSFMSSIYSFKESFDLSTSLFLQYVVLDYLKNNNLIKVIKNKIVVYKNLLHKTQDELLIKYGESIDCFSNIKGGLFFTIKFKNKIPRKEFCDMNKFYISTTYDNETRINICSFMGIK